MEAITVPQSEPPEAKPTAKPRHHNRGGRRPGAGRKPMAPEMRRSRRMSVRLTAEQSALLTYVAERRGVGRQEALRLILQTAMPVMARRAETPNSLSHPDPSEGE